MLALFLMRLMSEGKNELGSVRDGGERREGREGEREREGERRGGRERGREGDMDTGLKRLSSCHLIHLAQEVWCQILTSHPLRPGGGVEREKEGRGREGGVKGGRTK